MAGHQSRIMYIEQKSGHNAGQAYIGKVSFSRSGRTLYYKDMAFASSDGRGIYGNYYGYDRQMWSSQTHAKLEDMASRGFLGEFWISGPKKDGNDRSYENVEVAIDEDVAEEYWKEIRGVKNV